MVKRRTYTHLHWRAEVWGKDKEWDAEITEQTPDERISWRSVGGATNAGTVRFEPLGADSHTRATGDELRARRCAGEYG
jgi:uncharacterized membrane protein